MRVSLKYYVTKHYETVICVGVGFPTDKYALIFLLFFYFKYKTIRNHHLVSSIYIHLTYLNPTLRTLIFLSRNTRTAKLGSHEVTRMNLTLRSVRDDGVTVKLIYCPGIMSRCA
jgi:hypothetical protein